ncbi:DUF397 domain-containing protein [Streptomyces sp. NPDC057253]|uniref:DUF397 domain-containing protein n=1 Tax=Streptomyces sp. NPDC057253 TaxID=3346069 RepID=UPI0036445876
MTASTRWKRSSFTAGGDGNACVEIATRPTHIAIRDSKAPTRATLTFPPGTFTAFLESLKSPQHAPPMTVRETPPPAPIRPARVGA